MKLLCSKRKKRFYIKDLWLHRAVYLRIEILQQDFVRYLLDCHQQISINFIIILNIESSNFFSLIYVLNSLDNNHLLDSLMWNMAGYFYSPTCILTRLKARQNTAWPAIFWSNCLIRYICLRWCLFWVVMVKKRQNVTFKIISFFCIRVICYDCRQTIQGSWTVPCHYHFKNCFKNYFVLNTNITEHLEVLHFPWVRACVRVISRGSISLWNKCYWLFLNWSEYRAQRCHFSDIWVSSQTWKKDWECCHVPC